MQVSFSFLFLQNFFIQINGIYFFNICEFIKIQFAIDDKKSIASHPDTLNLNINRDVVIRRRR